jgi:excisionase family DNA binding protein
MERPSKDLLTITEVAQRLSISPRSVARAATARRLTTVRIGRSIRFRPADLDAFITAQRNAARAVANDSESDPVVHEVAGADGWRGSDGQDHHE